MSTAPTCRIVLLRHDRRYESVTELQQRYAAFQVSMGMIEAHNSKEARTYSLGVNSQCPPPSSHARTSLIHSSTLLRVSIISQLHVRDYVVVARHISKEECGMRPYLQFLSCH